jgi:hypothetical protein
MAMPSWLKAQLSHRRRGLTSREATPIVADATSPPCRLVDPGFARREPGSHE